MSDYNDLCRMVHAKLSTVILECPNGRFTLRGSVPAECCHEYQSGFTHGLTANSYDTEEEAKQALIKAGIKRFQLADCSWFEC